MLGRNKRDRETNGDSSTRQPLLHDSQEDLHEGGSSDLLFKVDDEEDDAYEEASALDHVETQKTKAGRSVHFQEEVQVYAEPLRSTIESRETGE